MKKYILCLISILCITFTSICFAGSNVITNFSGELISVSVISKDGQEYTIPGATGHISLNNEISVNAAVGEGKDLPAGKYKAIKYIFKNDFTAAGKIILNDGTEYGSNGTINNGPVFKKNTSPSNFSYKYSDGSDNWGWCSTNVSNGQLAITENKTFSLDENSIQSFNVNITLKYLWFGINGKWDNFDSDMYVKEYASAGREDFKRLDADTIAAPFIDPPEMENSFNLNI